MTKEERESMIAILILVTGWNERLFDKLTDEEVEKLYEERVG